MKKESRDVVLTKESQDHQTDPLESLASGDLLTLENAIFDTLVQFLLNSKGTKAELYLIGDYHNQ